MAFISLCIYIRETACSLYCWRHLQCISCVVWLMWVHSLDLSLCFVLPLKLSVPMKLSLHPTLLSFWLLRQRGQASVKLKGSTAMSHGGTYSGTQVKWEISMDARNASDATRVCFKGCIVCNPCCVPLWLLWVSVSLFLGQWLLFRFTVGFTTELRL